MMCKFMTISLNKPALALLSETRARTAFSMCIDIRACGLGRPRRDGYRNGDC